MSLAKNVVILDTGCCNLTSLKAAVERLGVDPIVSRDAAVIRSAQRLFLQNFRILSWFPLKKRPLISGRFLFVFR